MPAVAVKSLIAIRTPWNGIGPGLVDRARVGERIVSAHGNEGVESRIESRDAIEVQLHELEGRDFPVRISRACSTAERNAGSMRTKLLRLVARPGIETNAKRPLRT